MEEAAIHLAHDAGWPVGARLAAAVIDATERVRASWPLERPVGVVGVGALGGSGASGPAALAFLGYRAQWQRGEHAGIDQREGFVELARKDLGVAREVAASVSVDTTFTDAVADAMPAAYLTARS